MRKERRGESGEGVEGGGEGEGKLSQTNHCFERLQQSLSTKSFLCLPLPWIG